MGANSTISWTTHTFNPWRGCTKVAPGCANCYAEKEAKRFPANRGIWGPNGTRVKASDAMWKEPLKWDRRAQANQAWYSAYRTTDPTRPRVFCASLADVFEDWQGSVLDHNGRRLWTDGATQTSCKPENTMLPPFRPLTLDDLRRDLFALIDATPNLDWLLLTKRPENIRRMLVPHCLEPVRGHISQNEGDGKRIRRRENLWLGTSISDQATADAALPELLKCRDLAPVLFASYEPALGPVDFRQIARPESHPSGDPTLGHTYFDNCLTGFKAHGAGGWTDPKFKLDWLIVGGESGPHARPFDISWAHSAIEQCKAAGVPCFVKQLGAVVRDSGDDSEWPNPHRLMCPMTRYPDMVRRSFADKKGGDWLEWPEPLRVREFPGTEAATCN